MELSLQRIVNLSGTQCTHTAGQMACGAYLNAFEKDENQMLKLTLSAAAILSMSACMGGMDGPAVTRDYAGASQCSGFSGISATYINNNHGFPTRCGPQTQLPYSYR